MQIACAPEHPIAARADVDLAALADEPFIEFPEGWGTRMATDRAFAAAGVRRTIVYEVNDVASVIEFVSAGLAVALISPSLVVEGDAVALVPVRRHAPSFEISVVVAATRRPSAVLEEFLRTVPQPAS